MAREAELLIDMWNVLHKEGHKVVTEENYDVIQKAIKALNQEQKIGHWLMTSDYYTGAYGSIDYVECSCCHEYSLEEGNYCPNCGAKMESE